MMKRLEIDARLWIQGPILCKATASAKWGIDATFDRDWDNRPYIDRSHIKGKLRESMTEIGIKDEDEIAKLFGKEGKNENGNLIISNFYCSDMSKDVSERRKHRIRIDPHMGAVKEGALLMAEDLFPKRSSPYEWKGTLECIVSDKDEADNLVSDISAAFRWIRAIGGEKSVGFGRVIKAEVRVKSLHTPAMPKTSTHNLVGEYGLAIEVNEPIMIGSIKRESVFQKTDTIISGAMIKGAIAEALNLYCGAPRFQSIDKDNREVSAVFPSLVGRFDNIRICHAFPTTDNTKRPCIIPFSTVRALDSHVDIAFMNRAEAISGRAPVFQTDWKDNDWLSDFGMATPRIMAKIRTSIDSSLRRAKDNSMYAFSCALPLDNEGNQIFWKSNVFLPEGVEQAEFRYALELTRFIGKRRSMARLTLSDSTFPSFQPEDKNKDRDDLLILSLQTDALMIDPESLRGKKPQLRDIYNDYWKEISGGAFEMYNFFAMQRLLGGYIVKTKPYYPFFLTKAGSVFVLKKLNADKSAEMMNHWRANGLSLPKWVCDRYDEPIWQSCPFTPENGYGEVLINMRWHWDKQYSQGGE